MLNKPELARVARCYRDIDAMVTPLFAIPRDKLTREEESTIDLLTQARLKLGDLLRWQDFGGAWQTCVAAKKSQPKA